MKHTIRTKEYTTTKKVASIDPYGRRKAIHVFCTECLGYEDHPSDCTAVLCPLFPFRGKSMAAYVEGTKGEMK